VLVGFHVRRGDKREWVSRRNGADLPDGAETLAHMRQTAVKLSALTGQRDVIFVVATDEPEWCRDNLADPRGKLNIAFTSDHVKFMRINSTVSPAHSERVAL